MTLRQGADTVENQLLIISYIFANQTTYFLRSKNPFSKNSFFFQRITILIVTCRLLGVDWPEDTPSLAFILLEAIFQSSILNDHRLSCGVKCHEILFAGFSYVHTCMFALWCANIRGSFFLKYCGIIITLKIVCKHFFNYDTPYQVMKLKNLTWKNLFIFLKRSWIFFKATTNATCMKSYQLFPYCGVFDKSLRWYFDTNSDQLYKIVFYSRTFSLESHSDPLSIFCRWWKLSFVPNHFRSDLGPGRSPSSMTAIFGHLDKALSQIRALRKY